MLLISFGFRQNKCPGKAEINQIATRQTAIYEGHELIGPTAKRETMAKASKLVGMDGRAVVAVVVTHARDATMTQPACGLVREPQNAPKHQLTVNADGSGVTCPLCLGLGR
jgi:hypothetical protein